MKKIFLILLTFISLNVFSQTRNFKVLEGSFHKVEGCVTIPAHTDMNNLPMGLIKIIPENITEQERTRLFFEGNLAMDIEVEQKVGETWVYVTARAATFLRIKHPDFGVTEFNIPMEIEPNQCYEMVLQYIPPVTSSEQAKPQNNFLSIIADQPNAIIYIDGEYVGEKEGYKSLTIGTTHTWKVECDLYHTESGMVKITDADNVVNVNMRPAYGYLNVTSAPENDALVFINNKKVGTTPYKSDKLASGDYTVKVMKEMFSATEDVFTVTDGNTTMAKLDMSANFVTLTVSTDATSDIYIDENLKGKGSWSGRVSAGNHLIEVKKDNHKTVTKEITLQQGTDEKIEVEAPKPIYGFLEITSNPMQADVIVDGKNYGRTPKMINDLIIGNHKLELRKQGYVSLTKNITIKEGETLSVNEVLQADKATAVNNVPAVNAVDKKTQDKKPVDAINFVTLNAAYSVAPQTSFGLTYGHVKKVGFFVSAMSNFNFMFSGNAWEDMYNENEAVFTGESSNARLSLTGGVLMKIAGPVYVKLGAGYGMRVKCWELSGKWYEYAPDTYRGVDLTAGMMLNTKGLAISADVVTTNFKTVEIKLGIGVNFN